MEALDQQFRRLAKLEGECAQRAAGEARAAELVEQMRLKVQQFERQNGCNVENAEAELSRLSDDLQRALHHQHSLEIRVQQGEERVAMLRHSTTALTAERDAAAARQLAHLDECAMLQRRVQEERDATDTALQQLHESAVETERLRAKITDSETAQRRLSAELGSLQSWGDRRRRLEHARFSLMQRRQFRTTRNAFLAFAYNCPVAREERGLMERLRQRVRRSMVAAVIPGGAARQKLGFAGVPRTSRGSICVLVALSDFGNSRRGGSLDGVATRAGFVCMVGGMLRSALPMLATGGLRKALVRILLQAWRITTQAACQLQQRQACVIRLHMRRLLRELLREWVLAVVRRHELNDRTRALFCRRQLTALGATLRHMRKRASMGRVRVPVMARVHATQTEKLRRVAFAAFRRWAVRRRTIVTFIAALPARRLRLEREQVLPLAFAAFQSAREQGHSALSCAHSTRRLRILEFAAVAVQAWRAQAILQGREHAIKSLALARRRHAGMVRWCAWVSTRRNDRRCRAARDALHVRLAELRVGGRLCWWAKRVRLRRLRAVRLATSSARARLSLCRSIFASWDVAVRRSLFADCTELVDQAQLAGEKNAAMEAQRGVFDETQREGELVHAEFAAEIQTRVAVVVAMWANVEEVRSENAIALTCLEEDRVATEALSREVERLKSRRDVCLRKSEPNLDGLEAQLAEALEVQGSLRFAVLQSGADAERVARDRDGMEAREAELRARFDDSRRAYVGAIDSLDRKAISLKHEGREAQQAAQRLEGLLDNTAFHVRMCDLELQR
eukprot:CAMPEP_0117555362 /NCGR_PEP_ID=MMETSP0784-20121206/51235_1 /TAXON_ID=39447 /ORGANISM="" /LENGTH=794 /DNA_ID=CAMNT_0005352565 /DNA_START=42 /DNA_END=2426 /DNA_ORIENTATION=+